MTLADELLGALARRRPRSAARRGPREASIVTSARLEQLAQPRRDQVEQPVETSVSVASALPTSFSDSSWRDQRVAASYSRAFSIATAAWPASRRHELLVVLGEVARRRPSRSGRGCRRPRRAAGSARRGTSASAGGRAGSRPSAGPRSGRGAAAACASRISTPRMPRPRGRSPIAAWRLGVDPVRDEALELRAGCGRSRRARAYWAPVSSAATWTIRSSEGVERQLRGERAARLEQAAKPGLAGRCRVHSCGSSHARPRATRAVRETRTTARCSRRWRASLPLEPSCVGPFGRRVVAETLRSEVCDGSSRDEKPGEQPPR